MKRELGDICWYLAQACMALDTTFDEVIEMNVDKLQARYPGGSFDVHKSENRKGGRPMTEQQDHLQQLIQQQNDLVKEVETSSTD